MTDPPPLHHPLIDPELQADYAAPQKRPHRCCFCGCNMRASIITVQFFFGIFFPAVSIIAWATGYYKNYTSDPELIADLDAAYRNDAIVLGVGIVSAVTFSILGAFAYSPVLVAIGATYVIVGNSLSMYFLYPVMRDVTSHAAWYIAAPVVITLLTLYPHLGFIYEVRKGILTRPDNEVVPLSL